MGKERDVILFRIDRKTGLLILGAMGAVLGGYAVADQLTITTSYPVPSGVYNQLITTGNSGAVPADTTFNRNAGNTLLVPATNAAGMVGIGKSPAAKLSVAGGVQIGDDNSACTGANEGTQRWHMVGAQNVLQGCSSGNWIQVAGNQVIQTGSTFVPGANALISFPVPFAGVPVVVCSDQNCSCNVSNITPNGFKANVACAAFLQWIAIR